jgi:UDP-glucose 4-epimerase
MAILVTGGAGYIGSHTCVELLNAGYDVIVVDNFSNSKPEALKRVVQITGKNIKTYQVDLLEADGLAQVFMENDIDAVIHFAGLKAVGESALIPLRYYQNNITGTVNLCEVMRKYDVKKLVFSSSATVYGTLDNTPINEGMPLGAVSPYGRSKLMIEEMLGDLAASDPTWHIAILRYFNPIGAHESGLIGEDPTGIPNNLLPYISQVAIGKIKRLHVYGNDYPTKDGTGIRDYIHVVDLALGHIKALEWIKTTSGVDAFNLGTGKGYSVIDMIQAFEKASEKSIPYQFVERRQGDVAICFANPSKAKDKLNWQAKKGIDLMCEDIWRWQLNNPFGYEEVPIVAGNR